MTTLSGKSKKELRGKAQLLPSILNVGKKGITPEVIQSLEVSFKKASLLKITIEADRPERETLAAALAEALQAEIISSIGKTIALYRALPAGTKEEEDI